MTHKNSRFDLILGEDTLFLRLSDAFERQQFLWPTHRHCNAEYELHIVMNGSCKLEVGEEVYEFCQTDAIIIPPGFYHCPTYLSASFERLSVSFTLSDGALLRAIQNVGTTGIPFSTTPELLTLCRQIYREYLSLTAYRPQMLHALFSQMFIQLLRSLHLTDEQKSARPLTEEAERVVLMDRFFSNHFSENLCAEMLAKKLHLSRRQMCRVVQQHYGMSFQQKLTGTRMDRAAWLLRTSDKQVSQIAELVGYHSETAFYQVFRNWFHMTPGEYRKRF